LSASTGTYEADPETDAARLKNFRPATRVWRSAPRGRSRPRACRRPWPAPPRWVRALAIV